MKPTEFIVETSLIAQEADIMHQDHEVQMARSDCYNAAKYAIELHRMLKQISEQQGLDGWVSEKITLANDYLRTVHEYLLHEMNHGQDQDMMGFTAEAAEYAFNSMLNEGGPEDFHREKEMWHKHDSDTKDYGVATSAPNHIIGKKRKENAAKRKAEQEKNKQVNEMATGGGSSAGGIATSMGGPGHKPTSGVPKKVGNAHKPKKITVGKGVY